MSQSWKDNGAWLALGLTVLGAAASAYSVQRTCDVPGLGREHLGSRNDWITRPGKLGGSGYMKKSTVERHALLDDCVDKWGYRSCLGSIEVLKRNRQVYGDHKALLDADSDYLQRTYGGIGSFGSRAFKSGDFVRVSDNPAGPDDAKYAGMDGKFLRYSNPHGYAVIDVYGQAAPLHVHPESLDEPERCSGCRNTPCRLDSRGLCYCMPEPEDYWDDSWGDYETGDFS